MSGWTHAICDDCWDQMNPDRLSTRLTTEMIETCCWCLRDTISGIYMRADPLTLRCLGRRTEVHDEDNRPRPKDGQ